MPKCPNCQETIKENATLCPYCHIPIQESHVAPYATKSVDKEQVDKDDRRISNIQIIIAIALIFGSLTPWLKFTTIFGQITINGYEADGIFTMILGILLLLVSLSKKISSPIKGISFLFFGLFACYLTIPKVFTINQILKDTSADYVMGTLGFGLIIAIISSLFAIMAGIDTLISGIKQYK